jgi:hypothetical protein
VKRIKCNHDSSCSRPNTYWRIREMGEIIDGTGSLVSLEIPNFVYNDFGADYACTECGEQARLTTVKPEKDTHKQLTLEV